MPYERPGAGVYVTATKVTPHNAACTENGHVGVAVKQKAESWTAGYVAAKTIAIGERFHMRTKGEKQVPVGAGTPGVLVAAAPLGTAIYIRPADNTLQIEPAAVVSDIPYGRVTGVPGDAQGCPTGFIRIDLDQKDTIVPAV